MNATRPLCASAVTPINAINKTIIGNMWIFLLWIKNANTSLIVENLLMGITGITRSFYVNRYGDILDGAVLTCKNHSASN